MSGGSCRQSYDGQLRHIRMNPPRLFEGANSGDLTYSAGVHRLTRPSGVGHHFLHVIHVLYIKTRDSKEAVLS